MRAVVPVLITALLAVSTPAVAAPGDLDPSFGGDGMAVARFHTDGFGYAAALDAEGRLVVAGTGGGRFALARFLPSGELDPSFGGDGKVKIARGRLSGVATLPDGRIVGVGSDSDGWIVCRITESGELDQTFGHGGFAERAYDGGEAEGVALDPSGRILVAGTRVTVGTSATDAAVVRYRAGGVLDPSFSGDGRRIVPLLSPEPRQHSDGFRAVAPTPDGGMVLTGQADGGWIATVRLNADGSLTDPFGDHGAVFSSFGGDDRGESVIVTTDRIVIGAFADQAIAVLAYTISGDPDPGFGGGDGITGIDRGVATVVFLGGIAQDGSGRLVVVGTAVDPATLDVVVARLDGAGILDPTFGESGVTTVPLHFDESADDVAVRPTGEIVAGGTRTGAKANMMLALQLQG